MSKLQSFYRKHDRVQFICDGPSITQENFQDECNINLIMKKFEKHGIIDHLNKHQGDYGDFIGYPEYHESMNQVILASEMFMSIPSSIRADFGNDPSLFLQFAQNPENIDKMVEYGLASAPPPEFAETKPEKKGASPPATPTPSPEASDNEPDTS